MMQKMNTVELQNLLGQDESEGPARSATLGLTESRVSI